MILRRGYNGYDEAIEAANALLWEHRRKDSDSLTTKEHRRTDKQGQALPIAHIVDEDTGTTAYVYSIFKEGEYDVALLSGSETKEEGRTYPFRSVPNDRLPFLLALRTLIFKPTQRIEPEDVLTPEGLRTIDALTDYGETYTDRAFSTIEELGDFSIDEAFDEWEDGEADLLLRPFPYELSERTGRAISSPKDYSEAIGTLLGAQLTEEQLRGAERSYLFYASETLLKYALYEFMRTEDYSRLKEVLDYYPLFLLPDGWEEYSYTPLYKTTAAEYVLALYLSKREAAMIGAQTRIKDIAAYTSTPLSLMGRAYRLPRIMDF